MKLVQKKIHLQPKKYLSRVDAAEFLCCSLRTLDKKVSKGELPYIKLGKSKTSKVIFRREDLEKYLEKHLVQI